MRLRPHLLAVKPANDLEARVMDELKAWNLKCDPDQVGAAIYQVWYRNAASFCTPSTFNLTNGVLVTWQ